MAFDWYDIEEMDVTELRQVADRCEELIDEKMGNCTDCHGNGRENGDEHFECSSCDGTGKREDQVRILEGEEE